MQQGWSYMQGADIMRKKSSFWAKVLLRDSTSFEKEWIMEGDADDVLFKAIKFIGEKDQITIQKRIINYIIEDFKSFDAMMNKLFFKKND
jgi:hypothetical protein